MEWYWYCTGLATGVFVQSLILNIALLKGWMTYETERTNNTKIRIYPGNNPSRYMHGK
jgi:hypothetical protein